MKKQKIRCSTHISTREQAVEFAEKIIRSFCSTPELGAAMIQCASMFMQSRRHFGVVCSLSPNSEITLLGKSGIPRVEFVPCTWDSLRDQGADGKTIDSFRDTDWETLFPIIVACPYGYESGDGLHFSVAWIVRFSDVADVLLTMANAARAHKLSSTGGDNSTTTTTASATGDGGKGDESVKEKGSQEEKLSVREQLERDDPGRLKDLEEQLFETGGADLLQFYRDRQLRDQTGGYFQPGQNQKPHQKEQPHHHQQRHEACTCPDSHCRGKRKSPTPPPPPSQKKKTYIVTFVKKSHELYGGRKCDMIGCDERARGQCPKCKLAVYCNSKCQSMHWVAEHKHTCGQPLPEPLFVSKGAFAASIALSDKAVAATAAKHVIDPEPYEKPKIKRSNPILFYFSPLALAPGPLCPSRCHRFCTCSDSSRSGGSSRSSGVSSRSSDECGIWNFDNSSRDIRTRAARKNASVGVKHA